MYHYGWARPARAIKEKLEISKTIYPWQRPRLEQEKARGYLDWIPLLKRFTGAHPRVARDWVAARAHDPERIIGPRHLRPMDLRYYPSPVIQPLTAVPAFPFPTYT